PPGGARAPPRRHPGPDPGRDRRGRPRGPPSRRRPGRHRRRRAGRAGRAAPPPFAAGRRAPSDPPAPPSRRAALLRGRRAVLTARRRRVTALESALPGVLERVAAALRAGSAPLAALQEAARSADVPGALAADLARLTATADGAGLRPAVAAWAEARPLPAVVAVAAALDVALDAGGPAAQALDGLAA